MEARDEVQRAPAAPRPQPDSGHHPSWPPFRVSVRCCRCQVLKPIAITQGRYGKVWEVDWATIFERVRYRCRCGSLADALKVERHTHDRPEEVLFVWSRGEYHG